MNEIEIEATIAARKAEFWAAVDDENGERTNANYAQLEQILQDLRDSF